MLLRASEAAGTVRRMSVGDIATWVGSVAAVVAAAASVAVWRRGAPEVDWRIRPDSGFRVVNVGEKTARQVRVRLGSESNADDVEAEASTAALARGESLKVLNTATSDSADDVAIVVTWRGRFGRTEKWTHRLR
jgi:hypothetical protein